MPDYELLRPIGRGSYGVVWLARSVTGLYRAVKIVWRASFEDPQPYEREFRGIKEFAAISLVAPRQLALLHVGRNDAEGFFYYVMELADDVASGREIDPGSYIPNTLKEVRARRQRLPAAETLTLAVELAEGLAELHQRGLVHRDIKPSNIILVGGAPKLADIGLVASTRNTDHTLTRVGNPGYMPPDFPGDPSADVYGLAKVLYELVTGRERDDFPALPDLAGFADRKELLELNEILLRACAPQSERRYAAASALLEDLRLLQAGKSVRRLRAAERHLARALRAAAVLAIAATVAGTAAWLATREAKKEMALRAEAEKQRDELARRRTYSGNLASAQAALGQGDLSRARNLLKDLEPKPGEADLRGFEWRALWHAARSDPHQVWRASGQEIMRLALSPNERLLAVHDRSSSVTIYDIASQQMSLRIPDVAKLVGFSADGEWIVGSDKSSRAMRWSTMDGTADAASAAAVGLPIAMVGPSQIIALSSDPLRLRVWDFSAKREAPGIELKMEDSTSAWGGFIASASPDGQTLVRAWVRGSGSEAQFRLSYIHYGAKPEVHHRDFASLRPTAVGADTVGGWAFFEGHDENSAPELWRCDRQGWRRTNARLPKGTTRVVDLPAEAGRLRVALRGRELAWFSAEEDAPVRRKARGHSAVLADGVLSPKHGVIFTAASDGSLFAWPLAEPAPRSIQGWNSNAGSTNAVFSRDSRTIWVPKDGETCELLDLAKLRPIARATGMRYPLALTPQGLLGIGSRSGLIRVDPDTGQVRERIPASNESVRIAAVSTSGKAVAVIDHASILYALHDEGYRRLGDGYKWFFALQMDPPGERLWTINSTQRTLICLAWPEGTIRWQETLPALPPNLLVLRDRRQVAVALENGMIEFRDSDTGKVHRQVHSGTVSPQAMALSPDGRRFVVSGGDGEIHCFDTSNWEAVHTLILGIPAALHWLEFSPDGKTLAGTTKSGVFHLVRTE